MRNGCAWADFSGIGAAGPDRAAHRDGRVTWRTLRRAAGIAVLSRFATMWPLEPTPYRPAPHRDPRYRAAASPSDTAPVTIRLDAHTASRLNQLRDTNFSPR